MGGVNYVSRATAVLVIFFLESSKEVYPSVLPSLPIQEKIIIIMINKTTPENTAV